MLLLSLNNSCYYHYYYYFTISFIYPVTNFFIYLLLSDLCYFTYIFCHLLDFRYFYYLLGLLIYLSIYLYIYLFTYFLFALVYFILYHRVMWSSRLSLEVKVSLEVVSPHMIFYCKYLAILFLLVYTKICKIM